MFGCKYGYDFWKMVVSFSMRFSGNLNSARGYSFYICAWDFLAYVDYGVDEGYFCGWECLVGVFDELGG